jgi:hypothetical protein
MLAIDGRVTLKTLEGETIFDKSETRDEIDGITGRPAKVKNLDRRPVTVAYVIRAALCPVLPGQGKKDEDPAQKMDDFLLALKFADGAEPVEVTEKEHARIMELVNLVPFNKVVVAQTLVLVKHGDFRMPWNINSTDHEART